jgi:hypothetical protein
VNAIEDVHRSLREWIAQGLGSPPWKVRIEDDIPLTDQERPVAYVELVQPARTLDARATAPQGAVQRLAPFTVSAYPNMGTSPRLSRQEADKIADVLDNLVASGVKVAGALPSPSHVPIFDWQHIPLEGSAAERKLPDDAEPYTYALIPLGWTVQTIKDPMDPKRFTVGLALSLRWWAPGSEGEIGGESLGVEGDYEVPTP